MAEYLTPGQYMTEAQGERTIQGVSTSTAGFVGVTERGQFGSQLVTSFKDFVSKYGSYIPNSFLAYAVRGFFDNGGTRAYISRVVHYATGAKTSAKATINIMTGGSTVVANIDALSDGTWGNQISVVIGDWVTADKTFTLTVKYSGVIVETYPLVKLGTLEDAVADSKYISAIVLDATASIANTTLVLASGNDGLTSLADSDYVGDSASRIGVYAFENEDIKLLAVPGVTSNAVLVGVEGFVATRRVEAIMEIPSAKTPTTARAFRLASTLSNGRSDLNYSWIYVADPIGVGTSPTKLIPPSGHIIGMIARTDANRGVHKAPAGETDGKLLGALGVEYNVNDAEQALLNPIGVNCIRVFPGSGVVVWGARTMAPAGDVFMYLPVRRSVDYVEDSILSATRWTTFEPNNEILWGKIQSTVAGFLRGFWKSGGLKGVSEDEAFFVICDKSTTSEQDIAAGKVFCEIGIATQKPAEFIIFSVQVR